jgi:hypothetical protein
VRVSLRRQGGEEDSVGAMEVGQKLPALCRLGKNLEALDTLYDEGAVSIVKEESFYGRG